MDCWVYAPDQIDPNTTYWLVVGVHGYKGKGQGAGGYKSWAKRGDVIVIGPSFLSQGQEAYQYAGSRSCKKLIRLFEDLKKEYKLHDKMFVAGFSGGAQFAHRFAMNESKYVCGVAAHSGGTWANNGYGKISSKGKGIPFAISCGEKDTGKSFPSAPVGRLEWYKSFERDIDKKGFTYIGGTWPGVGHSQGGGARDLTAQCFQIATGLGGNPDGSKVKISAQWKNFDGEPKVKLSVDKKVKKPITDPATVLRAYTSASRQANTGKIEDRKLVKFMQQFPPVLWKDETGAGELLKQCQRAADAYKSMAQQKGIWNDTLQDRYKQFSDGL